MRDYVEIGVGREARRTYNLSDITVVPARRTRSSKDVDTRWNIDAYSFDIPFASSPSDALSSPEFVIEMGKQGGLGILNAEGLISRYEDYQSVIDRIIEDESENNLLLQEIYSAPIDTDLLTKRIQQVRESGVTVAVRVSPQNCRELAPVVIKAGAEILVVQGSLISAEHVDDGTPLNLKDFVGSIDIPVIAGGVTDYTTATHLMRAGVVGVIVGGASLSSNTALGIGSSMATAIADVAAARRDYLDETGGRYVHILAFGEELQRSGAAIKAVACGADAVILDEALSVATEAPGQGYYWPNTASHPKLPRGLVEYIIKKEERVPLEVLLHGPSFHAYGESNFVGALRRSLAKCGYTDLKSFQKVPLNISI